MVFVENGILCRTLGIHFWVEIFVYRLYPSKVVKEVKDQSVRRKLKVVSLLLWFPHLEYTDLFYFCSGLDCS